MGSIKCQGKNTMYTQCTNHYKAQSIHPKIDHLDMWDRSSKCHLMFPCIRNCTDQLDTKCRQHTNRWTFHCTRFCTENRGMSGRWHRSPLITQCMHLSNSYPKGMQHTRCKYRSTFQSTRCCTDRHCTMCRLNINRWTSQSILSCTVPLDKYKPDN